MEFIVKKWDQNSDLVLPLYKHTNPPFDVKITIYKDKRIEVRFIPNLKYDYRFNYHIGVKIWNNNRDNINNARSYISNNAWSWNASYNNGSDYIFNITDFKNSNLPIYILPLCEGCSSNIGQCVPFNEYGASNYVCEIQQDHIHETYSALLNVRNITAKTVTVEPLDKKTCEIGILKNNKYEYYQYIGNPIKINKYGSISDLFLMRKRCSCNTIYLYNNRTSIKYWSIADKYKYSYNKYYYKKLKFKFANIHPDPYTANNNISEKIKYVLYKYNSNGTKQQIKSKSANSDVEIIFDELQPNTKYYCEGYTEGVTDNKIGIDLYTANHFSCEQDVSINKDTKKINIKMNITLNDDTRVNYQIKLYKNNEEVNDIDPIIGSTTQSGEISKSIDYTTSSESKFIGVNKIKVTYTGYSKGQDTIEIIKENNIEEIYNVDGMYISSYEIENVTTRAVKINLNFKGIPNGVDVYFLYKITNNPNSNEEYKTLKINDEDAKLNNNDTFTLIEDQLHHNLGYMMYYKFKTVESGSETELNSTFIPFKTKKLDLKLNHINDSTLNEVYLSVAVYINDQLIKSNIDVISGSKIDIPVDRDKFKLYKINSNKKSEMYINAPDSNENINIISKNELDFRNGKYYIKISKMFRGDYELKCTCTDGINEVSLEIDFVVRESCIYIYDSENEKWLKLYPYIYTQGQWRKLEMFIFSAGNWRRCY